MERRLGSMAEASVEHAARRSRSLLKKVVEIRVLLAKATL